MTDDSEPSPSDDAFLRAVARAPVEEPPRPSRDLVGQRLGRYELRALIGRGGMGVVYRATDPKLGRDVALKVIAHERVASPARRQRFLREARAACAVEHEGIVRVHDTFEHEAGTPVIVMELLSGSTLREELTREGKLSEARTLAILSAVAAAVSAAHAMGVVHRDLKPENVFLTERGVIKVLDFGVAKLLDDPADPVVTDSETVLGTVAYMAPEQAFGDEVGPAVDVWALGVMLYECLSGVRPVRGASNGQLLKALSAPKIEPLHKVAPGVSRPLADLCGRMLSQEPSTRGGMNDVVGTLRLAAGDASNADVGVPPPVARPSRRGLVLAGVALLAAVALIAVWLQPESQAARGLAPSVVTPDATQLPPSTSIAVTREDPPAKHEMMASTIAPSPSTSTPSKAARPTEVTSHVGSTAPIPATAPPSRMPTPPAVTAAPSARDPLADPL
jgi:serine/threonine protein kinase